MSILQSKEPELRYLKRKNLEEEAKILGNQYRDIIRSYGIDVNYYKLDTREFTNFKNIVDQNAILLHAYGYDITPDYSISAKMLSYMEVETDIFNLQKIGLVPDTTVNFYFDSTDFACALAEKCGVLKEYPIYESEIVCEVPAPDNEDTGTFPYILGLGYKEYVYSDILSGKIEVVIDNYEVGKEYIVPCRLIEHSDALFEFPANEYIYRSFKHKIENTEYVDNLIFLKFKVDKICIGEDRYKYVLTGRTYGNILFYDIDELGKYVAKIHPNVGDVVTIDFPDENNREQYEITDCYNKSLQQDGISPLMHKYIWKCKARRYINNGEDFENNEANERVDEHIKYEKRVKEEVNKKIELYDENGYKDDAAYGGYDLNEEEVENYDKKDVRNHTTDEETYEYLDGQEMIDILKFNCGSKLCTNGYDLVFASKNGEQTKLTCSKFDFGTDVVYTQNGLRFLKATDNQVIFVNVIGESFKIAENRMATQDELEVCLNSLYDQTLDDNNGKDINSSGNSFYKFKESRTVLFATEDSLYCRLASDKKLYKLA